MAKGKVFKMKDLIERVYLFKIHLVNFLSNFLGFEGLSLGDYKGVNFGVKRETPIIVSIYASEAQSKMLPITLYSLLNQTIKPDRLILWLDDSQIDLNVLPYEITQFIKNGLEICLVNGLGSYTAIMSSLKRYDDSINVFAENGYYYDRDWLKKLYVSYISYSKDVQVHKAHLIKMKNRKENFLEVDWGNIVEKESAEFTNYIDKSGGILLPPKIFSSEVLREDVFFKYLPNNIELWIWVMSLVHNRRIRVVKNHMKFILPVNFKFNSVRKNEIKNKNDAFQYQMENMLKFYRQNLINKLN